MGEAVVFLTSPGAGFNIVYTCYVVAPFAFGGLGIISV
jgi:hypothetical protein